jgi:hypothetical protein
VAEELLIESSESDDFRTTDMSLAAVLDMDGHKFRMEWLLPNDPEDTRVSWVFENTKRVREISARYEQQKVKVEPRSFQRHIAAVRSVMYSFIDSKSSGAQ